MKFAFIVTCSIFLQSYCVLDNVETYVIINVFGWSVAMFQNVVVVSVIDHKNSPGFEQTVKVGNSSSLILLISTKRAKLSAFLFGIPVKVRKI